jgi:hypothetical protein
MRRAAVVLTTTLVCGWAGVWAHHPFSATYLFDEEVTIEGDVVALIQRNPHPFLHVQVRDKSNSVRQWAVEWAGRQRDPGSELMDVLMVGDHVLVTGSPGRDPGVFRILLHEIVRPRDGWRWTDTVR